MSAMKGTPEAKAFMAALRAQRKPAATKPAAKPNPLPQAQSRPVDEQDVAKRFMQSRTTKTTN